MTAEDNNNHERWLKLLSFSRFNVCTDFRVALKKPVIRTDVRGQVHRNVHDLDGLQHSNLFRLQRFDSRLKLNHRLGRIPHALEVRIKLRRGGRVADHDQVVVLRVLAASAEIR
jgi:hypothetical protein